MITKFGFFDALLLLRNCPAPLQPGITTAPAARPKAFMNWRRFILCFMEESPTTSFFLQPFYNTQVVILRYNIYTATIFCEGAGAGTFAV
jgi:hypothetical protein